MAQSLTRIHLQAFIALLLFLSVVGYSGYRIVTDVEQSLHREKTALTAQHIASRINEEIVQQRLLVEKIAQQPGTISSFQRGTEYNRRQEEIKVSIPQAVSVNLIPVDGNGRPVVSDQIDAACRDFMQRARSSDAASAAEFHAVGKSTEHYDLLTPVRDEQRKLLGYLLVGFASAPLQTLIERQLTAGGYVEWQQSVSAEAGETVIVAGDAPAKPTGAVTTTLTGTPWTLVYQPPDTLPAILAGSRIYYFILMLCAALAIIVSSLRLYRKIATSLHSDIKSFVRMFRDVREGNVRVDYPMELKEFVEVFDYLRDRGQKLFEERAKLKDMGLIDHLSQLSNRRHFEMRLKELFETSKANGPSSVLIIYVDHFKAVNDTHGHDAGDALIVGFAKALRKAVRQSDALARLGGDEFCIIYTYAPLEKARDFAERLRKQLPREILLTKGVMHAIKWTGGLSVMTDQDTKPDEVLWRADQALIQAKEAGRNMTKIHDPASGPPAQKKIMAS